MKFNWGTGIFLFYTIFALSLVFQVFKSTQYDNSLVVDNYYEEDLNYQAQFERKQNAQNLQEPVEIDLAAAEQALTIQFPAEVADAIGVVHLYRPSGKAADQKMPIQLDKDRQMRLSTRDLLTGRWSVRITWTSGSKEFFTEEDIYVPVL